MVKQKQSEKKKERISLYLREDRLEEAKKIARKMDVPLSFIFEDILASFLQSFTDDLEEEGDEPTMEEFYKWKFKQKREAKKKS